MRPHSTTPDDPDGRTDAANAPDAPDAPDASPCADFTVDLTSHELLRRAHVLDALGPGWNPVEVLGDEAAAYRLLYSGLSEEQRRVYDELVAAGVLPGTGDGRAAA